MYTVPAVTNVQTKQLIANFEKGEVHVATNGDVSDEGLAEVTVNAGGVKVNRELSVEELAQPGTARRLLLEFEARSKSVKTDVVLRGLVQRGTSANNRNSAGTTLEIVAEASQPVTTQHAVTSEIVVTATLKEEETNRVTDNLIEVDATPSVVSEPVAETAAAAGKAAVDVVVVEPVKLPAEGENSQTLSELDADQRQVESAVETLDAVIESGERTLLAEKAEEEKVEEVQKVAPVDEPKLEASKNVLVVHAIRDRAPIHDALLEKTLAAISSTSHSIASTDLSKFTATSAEADEERRKVAASDLLIIVYQPLFNSVPSSLQAWIEAVFIIDQKTGNTLFSGKNVIVLLTTPHRKEDFDNSSNHGDLSSYLNPPQVSVLRQLGFHVLEPHAIFGSDESQADDIIGHWASRLTSIFDEKA